MTQANKGFCVKQNVIVMLCFKHRTSNTSSWERARETCELIKTRKPPSTLQYLEHHISPQPFSLTLVCFLKYFLSFTIHKYQVTIL